MKRAFRRTAWALALVLCTAGCPAPPAIPGDTLPEVTVRRPWPGNLPTAKHIILFIGDGMQLEHEIAASRYITGWNYGLSFHAFPYHTAQTTWDILTYNQYAWVMNADPYDPDHFDPVVGYDPAPGGTMPWPLDRNGATGYYLNWFSFWGDDTHDPSQTRQPATDSAAAATAMATGVKTDPGNVAWRRGDPEDGALVTIGEQMRAQKGALFAVASTVPYNHATPACWAAHGPRRGAYIDLGESMLRDVKADVIIGGGHPLYYRGPQTYNYRYIAKNTYNEMRANAPDADYVFVERTAGEKGEDVLAAGFAAARASGKKLFGLFGGPGGDFEPPVPEDGAFAVHRATTENPLLHHIVTETLDYLSAMDEDRGFFVMFEQGDIDWANHANNYRQMIGTMWDLDEAVKAACAFVDRPDDDMDWGNTLLIVTADHANSYMRLSDDVRLGQGELPEQVAITKEDKAWEYRFRYPGGEVTYQSRGHTNEPVMVYAKGEAARLFRLFEGTWYPGTRLTDNTHIYDVCALAAGITTAQ